MKARVLIKATPVPTRMKQRPATHLVHFELTDSSATKVCVAGTFNNWKPEEGEMRRSDGKWTKDIALERGTYEYRLVVDGQWMPDPRANQSVVNPFGEQNSLMTVT